MSMPEHIVAIAQWQTDERDVGDVLRLAAELRRHSLAEPGCLGFEVFRNAEDPCAVLLVERYQDDAAVEAHRNAPHYRELVVGRIIPVLTDRRVELLRAPAARPS